MKHIGDLMLTEPVSTVWAVLVGLMNRKPFPRLFLLEIAGKSGCVVLSK